MANPYFNAAYYLANNQDLVIAGITEATAEQHYDAYGAAEGRAPVADAAALGDDIARQLLARAPEGFFDWREG